MNKTALKSYADIDGTEYEIVSETASMVDSGKFVELVKATNAGEIAWSVLKSDIYGKYDFTHNFGADQEEAIRTYLELAFGVNI